MFCIKETWSTKCYSCPWLLTKVFEKKRKLCSSKGVIESRLKAIWGIQNEKRNIDPEWVINYRDIEGQLQNWSYKI